MSVSPATPTAGVRVEWAPVPRVNLLPPEILAARGFSKVQRWLGLAVVGVLAVVGLGIWWAGTAVSNAQDALALSRTEASTLQQEEGRYAEVPRVLAQVSTAQAARERALATDVRWDQFLGDLALATPTSLWLTNVTVSVSDATQTAPPAATGDPLAPVGVGRIAIAGTAPQYSDVATWLDAMQSLKGIDGTGLKSATRVEPSDGSDLASSPVTFTTEAALTNDALSHRFDREAR